MTGSRASSTSTTVRRSAIVRACTAGFIALIVLLPAVPATPEVAVTLLNYIGLYSIVALGLVLLTGVGGMTSFGQAAFVGVGAYTTAYLTTVHGVSGWLTLWIGLAITVVCALVLGLVTVRLSGYYLPLGTIAWGISAYYLFGNMAALGRYDGINNIPPLELFGRSLASGRSFYYLIWIAVFLCVFATRNLLDSRAGRAIRALKAGGVMAESCGIHTERYKLVIFVYAAMLASLSGWLYAHLQRAVNPTPFGLEAGIEYLFMAVVGGVGYVWGAVLGAGLLTVIKDLLQRVLPNVLGESGNFEIVVFGVLLVLLLRFSQEGIWPHILNLFDFRDHPKIAPEAQPLVYREKAVPGEVLLALGSVSKTFGGLIAVNDVSFEVRAGEILGLIGPNGAGKSTTFNLMSGVMDPSSGEVRFGGRRIDRLPAREIAHLGIARTFQHVRLIPGMTVIENVLIGTHQRTEAGVVSAILRRDRAEEAQSLHQASEQLRELGLPEYADQSAGSLPLGKQRLVEIARALCCDPLLLLLDEPAAGLRYREKLELAAILRRLRNDGITILLVEHDMDFVMGLTDRVVVMDFGVKLAEGRPEEIQANPAVVEAYLGGVTEGAAGQ